MEGYEQNLHLADEAFDALRHDADRVLQKLLKNMVEKESLDGSVSIKIDVAFTREFIENTDPDIEGETRMILTPSFTHKIGSVMQIKDEAKGGINYEGMEMVWDDEIGEYVVKPIANTSQRSIFDADFRMADDGENKEEPAGQIDGSYIEARTVAALPAPSDDDADAPEDISDDFYDDGYGYEDPGEEY